MIALVEIFRIFQIVYKFQNIGDFVDWSLHIRQIDNLKKVATKNLQKILNRVKNLGLNNPRKNSESDNAIPWLETKNDGPSDKKNEVGQKKLCK